MKRKYILIITLIVVTVGLVGYKYVTVSEDILLFGNNKLTQTSSSKCIDSTGRDISTNLDVINEEISKKESCFQAVQMAESCAWGSSADVGITSSASNICTKEFESNSPSKELFSLLSSMKSLCVERYKKSDQGTLHLSVMSFCFLDALKWVTDVSAHNY